MAADDANQADDPRSDEATPPGGIRGFLKRNERAMWWAHSVYALALGSAVAYFAERQGFREGRWLAISLIVAGLVIFILFKAFGSGRNRSKDDDKLGSKLGYYALTGLVKNSFQGMLFFLLPWYWKATTLDSPNAVFVVLLGIVALLSTIDVFVDNVVMKYRVVAAAFYFFVLFAATNLVVPALLPATRSLLGLLVAAALAAIGLWLMLVPLDKHRHAAVVGVLMAWVAGCTTAAYFTRARIPPVAMHIVDAGVSPTLLPDGRLALHATTLHRTLIPELHARTEVATPGGKGDALAHEWRHNGNLVHRDVDVDGGSSEPGSVILQSHIVSSLIPADPIGPWTVDVVTDDGQLVGRVRFQVVE